MTKISSAIINGITGIILLILSLRLVLRLFGANPNVEFTQFTYNVSAFFLEPFQGIFPTASLEGATFEISTLFAIIVYALVGSLLTAILDSLSDRNKA
ncbi:MAG: YggT family protein [Candidatus Campbellbacteria bacterium]|nr:YggT family protein [Candidatus Campbellbacteria bacterium]